MATPPNAGSGRSQPQIEAELRRLINYLNDEVVPEVRKHSASALRIAAEGMHAATQKLGELADELDRKTPRDRATGDPR